MKLWALALVVLLVAMAVTSCGTTGCGEDEVRVRTGTMWVKSGHAMVPFPQYSCKEKQ